MVLYSRRQHTVTCVTQFSKVMTSDKTDKNKTVSPNARYAIIGFVLGLLTVFSFLFINKC